MKLLAASPPVASLSALAVRAFPENARLPRREKTLREKRARGAAPPTRRLAPPRRAPSSRPRRLHERGRARVAFPGFAVRNRDDGGRVVATAVSPAFPPRDPLRALRRARRPRLRRGGARRERDHLLGARETPAQSHGHRVGRGARQSGVVLARRPPPEGGEVLVAPRRPAAAVPRLGRDRRPRRRGRDAPSRPRRGWRGTERPRRRARAARLPRVGPRLPRPRRQRPCAPVRRKRAGRGPARVYRRARPVPPPGGARGVRPRCVHRAGVRRDASPTRGRARASRRGPRGPRRSGRRPRREVPVPSVASRDVSGRARRGGPRVRARAPRAAQRGRGDAPRRLSARRDARAAAAAVGRAGRGLAREASGGHEDGRLVVFLRRARREGAKEISFF